MTDAGLPQRIVVAVGGNAIHPENIVGTSEEQRALAAHTANTLLPLITMDNAIVLTHGNGPIVGKILMRQVLSRDRVTPMPLDICVAHSQGGIAYLLMQAFENALAEIGHQRDVAVLLSQVEVDRNDPAFNDPTKPIGPFFSESDAKRIGEEMGWLMREDSGRGWRHVVASPAPRRVRDLALVRVLAERGSLVITGGGGGVPVVRDEDGRWRGIEAVVDKDLTSALMATALGFDTLLILTAVSQVAINYGRSDQKWLDTVSLGEIKALQREGQFPSGSMGPKVQAAINFVESGGKKAIIGHLDEAVDALRGITGTRVVADPSAV